LTHSSVGSITSRALATLLVGSVIGVGSARSKERTKHPKPRRRLPRADSRWDGGLSAGDRPYWQRLYGISGPANQDAWDRFASFAIFAVVAVIGLFGLLVLVAMAVSR
jgi:hypothetical protein